MSEKLSPEMETFKARCNVVIDEWVKEMNKIFFWNFAVPMSAATLVCFAITLALSF